jgi:hypothetical protein
MTVERPVRLAAVTPVRILVLGYFHAHARARKWHRVGAEPSVS